MLDLKSVRLFVQAVELGSLTRAAEAAGTVQPVVSQRLRALELSLGRKLLERTPRFVRPTPDGAAFLERARALLAAHDQAVEFTDAPGIRLVVGISDHALGLGIEQVLRTLRAALPSGAVLEVRSGMSQDMRALFDAGLLDATVIRREGGGAEGEVLGKDPLGWRAAPGWTLPFGAPIPLATLAAPSGVRAVAIRQLDAAKLPWRESFVGGSCAALLAGVRAGLGIAAMGRAASGHAADLGPALNLPALPDSEIVLFARTGSPASAAAIRALESAVRASLR
jgi:DNA-binding transcriptional LysR family regulator